MVGCGNGDLVYFQVDRNKCEEQTRIPLVGALTGLRQSADGQCVVAVTSQGYVYQVDN